MKRIARIFLKILLVLFIVVNIITAFHAYKFTHFYDAEAGFAGPANKSAWSTTKDILFGINAVKKKNTVPDSNFQTVTLVTKDSIHLEGWYIPTDNTPKGTVILYHGHGGTKSGTMEEAAAFRNMHYNTLAMDFRAHGSSGGNTCTIGFNESEDVKLAYDYLRAHGEKNIILWGISMGGATITKAIYDYDIKPEKVILEMPFGSILDAAEGRIRMMKLPGEPLATLVTFWGGVEHGFWAFNMKPSVYAKKISCPVLLQWGRLDPRVAERETNAIYNNITAPKKLVIYDSSAHESLCKKENEKWVKEVSSFLQ